MNICRTTCNAETSTQSIYAEESCSVLLLGAIPLFELANDECIIFKTAFFVINIHTVMDRCVIDSESVAIPTYCGEDIAAEPTSTASAFPNFEEATTPQPLLRRLFGI